MHYRPSTFAAAALLLTSLGAQAEIIVEEVDYQDGDVVLRGYLVWDDASDERRPGVLVAHEWWGLNDYMLERSKQLAELGYVAFAGDMYGDADWQLVNYAGAKHGFTNPNVASFGMEALQYDAKADQRSWQLMQSFLSEVFSEGS